MTSESENDDFQSQDEWETYRQVFLDESDEDLESLTQSLLRLEGDPHDSESLNEAFRLLHTHKGSAGLMGFEGISDLAHQLENRFEQFRSGSETLNRERITVLLRCVDFLKTFNAALRAGEPTNQDGLHLLQQLEDVERRSSIADSAVEQRAPETPPLMPSLQGGYRLRVEFEDGLQLADMKARLIVARLSNIGEIIATDPPVEDMQSVDGLKDFVLIVLTDRDSAEVREIANVDGVRSVRIEGGDPAHGPDPSEQPQAAAADVASPAEELVEESPVNDRSDIGESDPWAVDAGSTAAPDGFQQSELPVTQAAKSRTERAVVAETVRVDIDRLDKLMNLTGELVVTKARLSQIVKEMSSAFRGGGSSNRAGDLRDRFRLDLNKVEEYLRTRDGGANGCQELLKKLGDDVELVDEQFAAWETARRRFAQIAETTDQLNQVSSNLQQSVLDTRMVPVAPLFNRFRRVIRDLAGERQKQVRLEIRGEKTELDKRMIDELGDPLLHLIRNSLDHGLELPGERRRLGKPETGTIVLEAAHRGNNVFITIRDDGAGLNIERIKKRAIEKRFATENVLAEMSEQQIIEYIWYPGFSTAERATEISGRGVGMDVVKNRIAELNGSMEIESKQNEGTSFNIRLPLTLAIIRSLLTRYGQGYFSVPIEDVREIVAVQANQIHSVYGRETIEVRGEFIPLIRMDRVFCWHGVDFQGASRCAVVETHDSMDLVKVVILHAAGRTIGLCVDELFGSSDIVIKSLSDNFVPVRGLSGASIMGDGTVCLMLDTSEVTMMSSEKSSGAGPSSAS